MRQSESSFFFSRNSFIAPQSGTLAKRIWEFWQAAGGPLPDSSCEEEDAKRLVVVMITVGAPDRRRIKEDCPLIN
jgi:hypothetical protein